MKTTGTRKNKRISSSTGWRQKPLQTLFHFRVVAIATITFDCVNAGIDFRATIGCMFARFQHKERAD
ncbi:hypothetical protein D3C87_1938520 [compost metagenome]